MRRDRGVGHRRLAELAVAPQVAEACLVDGSGTGGVLPERGRREAREAGEHGGPDASPTPAADDAFCLVSATGQELECFPTRKEAEAARDALAVEVTEETYCVTDGAGCQDEARPTPTPTSSPTPRPGRRRPPSPSPTPAPTAFSALSLGRRPPMRPPTEADAQGAVQDTQVQAVDSLYCVISSADQNLGCFIDRASAEERQRSTGQQRLLDVIGQTARLEERPVLAIVPPDDPAYATTPVTCPTDADRERRACSFSALEDQEVVYEDEAGNRFRLGAGRDLRRRRGRGRRDPGRGGRIGVDRERSSSPATPPAGSPTPRPPRSRCRRPRTRSRSSSTA